MITISSYDEFLADIIIFVSDITIKRWYNITVHTIKMSFLYVHVSVVLLEQLQSHELIITSGFNCTNILKSTHRN